MSYAVILKTITSAVGYSLVVFFQKHQKDGGGESIDTSKMAATAILGGIVGLIMFFAGDPVSQQAIQVQLVTYAGGVSMLESFGKGLLRYVKNHWGG